MDIKKNKAMYRTDGSDVFINIDNKSVFRMRFCTDRLLRFTLANEGSFTRTHMEEWSFVNEMAVGNGFNNYSINETESDICIETLKLCITINKQTLGIAVNDSVGKAVFVESEEYGIAKGNGSALGVEMQPKEEFFGFGFQRKFLNARGHKVKFGRTFRADQATVPFFLSSAGYGLYSINLHDHDFDFTKKLQQAPEDIDFYTITASSGGMDFYLIYGPSFKDIIHDYTLLTGRAEMAPKWALGLCYIARYFEDSKKLMEIAQRFRSEDIPCDMIGLEPGWEEVPYSMNWLWSKERFPEPEAMISRLKEMGYHFELWESGDAPLIGITDTKVRKEWFSKRFAASLDIGVDFFKQDDPYPRSINTTEMQAPVENTKVLADGELDECEIRNISNTLYIETFFEEFKARTGRRTLGIFCAYHASYCSHRTPVAWAADFEMGCGAASASLSGHAMVSFDMRSETPAGIHFGFMVPFSIIDSWAYYREPWLYSEPLKEITRQYAKLKNKLFPYHYSTLYQAHKQGIPMLRPMLLEFQEDPETHHITGQHMIGDYFLAGLGEEIYLPEGMWIDYWTRESVKSKGEWRTCNWPDTAGGPIFIKAGAIIPMSPATSFIVEETMEVCILDIYPGPDSSFELYEDDGISLDYEKDEYAITNLKCIIHENNTVIEIGARQGSYKYMPERRAFLLSVHMQEEPESVKIGDYVLNSNDSYEKLTSMVDCGWFYEQERKTLWIKPTSGWTFKEDKRGTNDPDKDTPCWSSLVKTQNSPIKIIISNSVEDKTCQCGNKCSCLSAVAAVETTVTVVPAAINVTVDINVLLADGSSRALVTAVLLDADGNLVKSSGEEIIFSIKGVGRFLSNSTQCCRMFKDGVAKIVVEAGCEPGNLKVTAKVSSLTESTLDIKVVKGTFDIVINPPERIRLNFGFSWLSYIVDAYATIKVDGKVLKTSESIVKLQILGEETKFLKRKFEVLTYKGVAEIRKIHLGLPEDPPKMTLRFTADGVEPAEVKVY